MTHNHAGANRHLQHNHDVHDRSNNREDQVAAGFGHYTHAQPTIAGVDAAALPATGAQPSAESPCAHHAYAIHRIGMVEEAMVRKCWELQQAVEMQRAAMEFQAQMVESHRAQLKWQARGLAARDETLSALITEVTNLRTEVQHLRGEASRLGDGEAETVPGLPQLQ